jgi:hypothetical protein
LGLFQDERATAISISSDGAQLTMKKQSNLWLLIVVLLNLPPEICYKAKNVIFPLAIPGPLAPGNVESFIYPLFEEMAQASVGMWTWDAVDSSYFVLRAYLCGVKGDMLGSAKLSGMAGHSALYGDHFSLVQGAHPARQSGCYGRSTVVSDMDGEGVCPECRWRKDARTGLCRNPYNGAVDKHTRGDEREVQGLSKVCTGKGV